MAGFLYFLPDRNAGVKLSDLCAMGLAHAFEKDRDITRVPTEKGPGGRPGVVVADATHVKRVGYYSTEQRWQQMHGLDAWVGIFTNQVPTPNDLRRADILHGYPVELADGKEWTIPLVRACAANDDGMTWTSALPARMDIDSEGRAIAGIVLPSYQQVWEVVHKQNAILVKLFERVAVAVGHAPNGDTAAWLDQWWYVDSMLGLDAVELARMDRVAMTLLGANHRIGTLAEAVLLDIFTMPNPYSPRIFAYACDVPGYLEIKKKAGLDGGPSGDGKSDDTPDTDQH